MIRQARAANDIQSVVLKYMQSFQTSSPWNRWSLIYGYPTTEHHELQSLIIFVMPPKYLPDAMTRQQGAKIDLGKWSMRIGAWDSRMAGGTDEIGIAVSQILYIFRNKDSLRTATFDITTDAVYTETTINKQGLRVQQIDGPFEIIKNTDTNEFRYEFDLYLKG